MSQGLTPHKTSQKIVSFLKWNFKSFSVDVNKNLKLIAFYDLYLLICLYFVRICEVVVQR